MAHFAELDQNSIVKRVIVVNNNDILDENGNESESVGINFLHHLFGDDTIWKQTSYNNNFRNKYAGPGNIYREDLDIFISPSPYRSWVFDEQTLQWIPPIPKPESTENIDYIWNEENQSWDEVTVPTLQ